jgi:hypothetical protein
MKAAAHDDAELLARIQAAAKADSQAVAAHEKTTVEVKSRARALGVVLLEARRAHPDDFWEFIKPVTCLKRSRIDDCLRIAAGRTESEQIAEEERQRKLSCDRVKKHRNKKVLPPITAEAVRDVIELEEHFRRKSVSTSSTVTSPDVTVSSDDDGSKRKAENGRLHSAEIAPTPSEKSADKSEPAVVRKAALLWRAQSAIRLAEYDDLQSPFLNFDSARDAEILCAIKDARRAWEKIERCVLLQAVKERNSAQQREPANEEAGQHA